MNRPRAAGEPETFFAREETLRGWIDQARPGDRAQYAIGAELAGHPTARIAREAHDSGRFELGRKRQGKGWLYYIKCKDPPAGQAPDPADGAIGIGKHELAVYGLLCERAAAGLPCPTNDEIAEQCGLEGKHAARYRFNRLVNEGMIKVLAAEKFGPRVIEIAASGSRTADPEGLAA